SSRALAALLAASFFPHAAGADQHEHCDSWAEAGECEANPDFMWGSCESSCSRRGGAAGLPGLSGPRPAAQDVPAYDKAHCASWAEVGECEANSAFMMAACPESCRGRGPATKEKAPPHTEAEDPGVLKAAPGRRSVREEQQRQLQEIQRKAEILKQQRQRQKEQTQAPRQPSQPQRGQEPAAAKPKPSEGAKPLKEAAPVKPWQTSAPPDGGDGGDTTACMREKFEIARQLDDASAREQHLWERGEAANSRAQLSEERLRNCLNDLSEANHERQKLRVQRSEGVSDTYEHRFQEMREQFKNEMEQRVGKLQKECSKREFQLQELAKASSKRADEAEHRLADKVTGADRIEAEQRAAAHAAEAEAAEVARLKIEEAYRAEGLRAASREQELKIRLEDAEDKIQQLKKALDEAKAAVPTESSAAAPAKAGEPDMSRQLLQEVTNLSQVTEVELPRCHAGHGEELSNALQAVVVKTMVLMWAPIGSATGVELPALAGADPQLNESAPKPLLWMDLHADSILQALSSLIPESQQGGQMPSLNHKGLRQEPCELRPARAGSALLALAWLSACIGALIYAAVVLVRSSFPTKELAPAQAAVTDAGHSQAASLVAGRPGFHAVHKLAESVLLPVMRFFDSFSVPEDVRRIAERRAEFHGGSAGRSPTTMGASGSEPEPEEMRRPAVLEALLAAEDATLQPLQDVPAMPRPASPRFGDEADHPADQARAPAA
ncbi:unnamed protein product, partial [Symbiodinium sp. CCMP2592]